MCYTCGYRPTCPIYAACTVDGKPATFNRKPGWECPIGRWPDAGGLVRWMGLRWMGTPKPVRVWVGLLKAWSAYRQVQSPGYFPACGCIYPLKRAWLRLTTRKKYPPPKVIQWGS